MIINDENYEAMQVEDTESSFEQNLNSTNQSGDIECIPSLPSEKEAVSVLQTDARNNLEISESQLNNEYDQSNIENERTSINNEKGQNSIIHQKNNNEINEAKIASLLVPIVYIDNNNYLTACWRLHHFLWVTNATPSEMIEVKLNTKYFFETTEKEYNLLIKELLKNSEIFKFRNPK
ncbi:608_t:CDS:2, partial [Racocetra persica]